MSKLGQLRTPKTIIGTSEIRIGPMNLAGKLGPEYSIGLVDDVVIDYETVSVELKGLWPLASVESITVGHNTSVKCSARERSYRNMGLVLGHGSASAATDVAVTTTGFMDAGETEISLVDTSDFTAGDWVLIWRDDRPETATTAKVASVAPAYITIDHGLAEAISDLIHVRRITPLAIGSQTETEYFALTVIQDDHNTQTPYVYNFWKASLEGSVSMPTNAREFASMGLTFKVIEPIVEEYESVSGPLHHLADVIPYYPAGQYHDCLDEPYGVTAEFTADTTADVSPLTVHFSDASSGNPTQWFWDFGDNSTSTSQNPTHVYTSAGEAFYNVTLSAYRGEYADTEYKPNYIYVIGTAYRYWMIFCNADGEHSIQRWGTRLVQMFPTIGGNNVSIGSDGYTNGLGDPDLAFDNSGSGVWYSDGGTQPYGGYGAGTFLGYDFGTETTIRQISITVDNNGNNYAPMQFDVLVSNDGNEYSPIYESADLSWVPDEAKLFTMDLFPWTLSPQYRMSGLVLSNLNRTVVHNTGTSTQSVLGVKGRSFGKRYFAVKINSLPNAQSTTALRGIGVAPITAVLSSRVGSSSNGYAYLSCPSGGSKKQGDGGLIADHGHVWTTNTHIGIGVDFTTGAIETWTDGVSDGVLFDNLGSLGTLYPMITLYGNGDQVTLECNNANSTGFSEFTRSIPSGYTAWGT